MVRAGGFDGETVSALEGHFAARLFLRGVELTLDSLTGYQITAVAGAGESILSGGAASANGAGLTTPIATRRFVAGTGITITPAAGSLTIATTGYRIAAVAGAGESILSGGAASADGNGLTTQIDTRRIVAGAGITMTPAAGSLTLATTGASVFACSIEAPVSTALTSAGPTVPVSWTGASFAQSAGANFAFNGTTEFTVARAGFVHARVNCALSAPDTLTWAGRGAFAMFNNGVNTSVSKGFAIAAVDMADSSVIPMQFEFYETVAANDVLTIQLSPGTYTSGGADPVIRDAVLSIVSFS